MAGSTGTITITENNTRGHVKQVSFAWLTGTSNQKDVAPATATAASYNGKILACITSPSLSGAQPDDNYDITITDSNGWDLLNGAGQNRDEATTEFAFNGSTGAETFRMLPFAWTQLTLNITNAGTGKGGTVTVYLGV